MNWYLEVLSKYAVFSGRASREEYWMFFLLNTLVSLALGLVWGIIAPTFVYHIISIYFLATIIPILALGVRRMHDIGRSGWWLFVPVVGFVFLFFGSQPDANEYGLSTNKKKLIIQLLHLSVQNAQVTLPHHLGQKITRNIANL